MNTNTAKRFILSNSLTAVSAVEVNGEIFATDGIGSEIHRFDTSGHQVGCLPTIRPLRRLRKNTVDGGYTALSCCGARLYFLDGEFIETGYTDLETTVCDCDSVSETAVDASVTCIGNERIIVAAFEKGAYLYNGNGKRITKVCETDRFESLTDFVHPSADFFAMSATHGGLRTVSVSDGSKIQTAISDSKHRLKMFIPADGGLDALFCIGYLYNRILPIYRNGVLELPK